MDDALRAVEIGAPTDEAPVRTSISALRRGRVKPADDAVRVATLLNVDGVLTWESGIRSIRPSFRRDMRRGVGRGVLARRATVVRHARFEELPPSEITNKLFWTVPASCRPTARRSARSSGSLRKRSMIREGERRPRFCCPANTDRHQLFISGIAFVKFVFPSSRKLGRGKLKTSRPGRCSDPQSGDGRRSRLCACVRAISTAAGWRPRKEPCSEGER